MLEKFLNRTDFSSYEDFKQNYAITIPEDFNFATHIVDKWAETDPSRLALLWCDSHTEERSFTFGDISSLSQKAAQYLISLGIKKGDKVMTLLKRRWEYWVTAVACHRIGAVLIPASYQLSAKDISYRINKASVKLLIAAYDPWILEQTELALPDCSPLTHRLLVGGEREGWLDYEKGILSSSLGFLKTPDLTVQDDMLIYFTSGTTGMPKMALHNMSYPLGHVVTARYWQQVQDRGLHLTFVDSGWAKFGWGCLYGQWISGSAILGYDAEDKFNPRHLIEIIRTHRPTTLCVPGTIYRFLMRDGLTKEDFASVTHCCTAGEPLAPEIVHSFYERTGLSIHEGYGQSESSVLVANFPWFPPRAGSMGKPSPLYDIDVVDKEGNSCPAGEEGELVVRNLHRFYPAGLFQGYWDGTELTHPYGKDGIYHTGDMVWRDTDGYFWFMGRDDDMIKCSAYRIGPFEIESVLLTHPAVLECAITGAPDPIRGQVVKASIVLAKGFQPSEALTKELQDYVKHMTAPYKYPRVIDYLSALPKTTSGKIIRKALR